MEPDRIADILEILRRKEAARQIAKRILDGDQSGAVASSGKLMMGWSQCGSNAGRPEFRDECADGRFACQQPDFACTVMFFDCGQFSCGDGGFSCQQHGGVGRDFVCGGRNDCSSNFDCNRDHGYYCLSSDLCQQTFSCRNGPGRVPCQPGVPLNEYSVGADTESGDFYCGISGRGLPPGPGFTCSVNFGCTTVDRFTCGETNSEHSAFACMTGDAVGVFTCTSELATPVFECNPGGDAETKAHNYTCSAGLLGGYGPTEP